MTETFGMIKEFEIKGPDQLPPRSQMPGRVLLEVSNLYFAKVETIGGEVCNNMACYDFRENKWRFLGSGAKRIIEYYIEK